MGEVVELFPRADVGEDSTVLTVAKRVHKELDDLEEMGIYLKDRALKVLYRDLTLELQVVTAEYRKQLEGIEERAVSIVTDPDRQRRLWDARMNRFRFDLRELWGDLTEALREIKFKNHRHLYLIPDNDNPESH